MYKVISEIFIILVLTFKCDTTFLRLKMSISWENIPTIPQQTRMDWNEFRLSEMIDEC